MSQNVACNFEIGSTVSVKCTARKGMFSHELAVLIRGRDQWYESLVDAELVCLQENEGDGVQRPATIRATVVNVNCTNVLVELPRQVVAGGRRIWIPTSEVVGYGDSVTTGD